jgi:endonuclease III
MEIVMDQMSIDEMLSTPVPNDRDDLIIQIDNLKGMNDSLSRNVDHWRDRANGFENKINAVKGFIQDIYSMNGEINDDIKEIATLLGIELTKTINVTVNVTFSGTATVALDFDPDDLEGELCFSCDEGYSDIEWDMDVTDESWDVRDDY